MSKTTAFAYLRVSGRGQIKGDGFPRQRAAIRRYAAEHGLRIARVFEERGVAGAKESMDRPAWAEMMTALHGDGVRTVVIEKLDRLARDLMVQETAIADLQKQGFALVSVQEPDLMANEPARVMYRQLMGMVAQYEKSMIVLKLRGARQRMKAATGRCEGRKPFGAKPGEAAVRDRIRSMREAGSTLQSICDALNSEGQPTRCGGRWMPMTVRNIARR
jgi:DNA invertase Pin-like site-specific DNA recombinase